MCHSMPAEIFSGFPSHSNSTKYNTKSPFFRENHYLLADLREICTCHVLRYTSGTVINFRYVIHLTKGNLSLLLLPDRRRTNYCSTTIGRGFESWRPSTTAVQLTWQSYDVTVTATALRRPPCRASKRLLSIAWKLERCRGVRAWFVGVHALVGFSFEQKVSTSSVCRDSQRCSSNGI